MGRAACLGREHDSTPQSGVEAPRLFLKEPPLLLLFGTLLNVCVCTLHKSACAKLTANSTHAGLKTWARAPQKSTYPSPGMNRTDFPHHADCNASSYNQHLRHQDTQNNAASSKRVAENAWNVQRGVLGYFCSVKFFSYQDQKPPIQ